MDYDQEIILACQAAKKELDAIEDYTCKLQQTQNEAMRQVYTDNRADELPHIQNLVIALTAMLNGEDPEAAARMDEEPVQEGEAEMQEQDEEAQTEEETD